MNRRASLLLAVVAIAAACVRAATATGSPGVRFRSIDAGFAEARASGQPLLLFFTADWCTPCRNLELDVFRSSHFVKGIEADLVPVKVVDRVREDGRNAEDVQALQRNVQVTGFPTLVVVHADGVAAVRIVGYADRSSIVAFLRGAPARLEAAEEKKRSADVRQAATGRCTPAPGVERDTRSMTRERRNPVMGRGEHGS